MRKGQRRSRKDETRDEGREQRTGCSRLDWLHRASSSRRPTARPLLFRPQAAEVAPKEVEVQRRKAEGEAPRQGEGEQ